MFRIVLVFRKVKFYSETFSDWDEVLHYVDLLEEQTSAHGPGVYAVEEFDPENGEYKIV